MADEDVKIVIKQKGTIPVYTKTKVGVAEVHHDETLKGSGTINAPLGISDEVMEEIENAGKIDDVRVDGVSVVTDKIAEIDLTGKVDKTSEADKVYGTDAQGNQTTYDVNSFGKIDNIEIHGVTQPNVNKTVDLSVIEQMTVLPVPSSIYDGRVVQYIGETTATLTHNCFYECTSRIEYTDATRVVKSGSAQLVASANIETFLQSGLDTNTPYLYKKHGAYWDCIDPAGVTIPGPRAGLVVGGVVNQNDQVILEVDSEQINEWAKVTVQSDVGVEDVLVNGTSVVTNKIAEVEVPTAVSQLTNDADYQNGTQVSNTVSGAITTHNTSNNAHSNLLTPITQDIDAIEEKIPAEASSSNQLADKDYVDSQIGDLNEWTTEQYTPTTTNFVVGNTYTVEEAFQRTASLFEGQQDEIDDIEALIPTQATAQNQLADKSFVNATIATNSANFRGNWATWALVPTDANLYPEDYVGSRTPTNNDYMVVDDATGYGSEYDGSWRFLYVGDWTTSGKSGWQAVYRIGTAFTQEQQAAIDSGITATMVDNYVDPNSTASTAYNARITAVETDKRDIINSANKVYATDANGANKNDLVYDKTATAETIAQRGTDGVLKVGTPVDNADATTKQYVDAISSDLNNHIADKNNPHEVTKAQVGLGNVDNTSDLNKPISTATQTALNTKQDTLVSGTNIKTINNESLLGDGNITISTTTNWGGIGGTLSDQTDLQEALDKRILQDDSLSLFPVGEEEDHVGEIRQYIGADYPLNKKFHGYFYQWTKTKLGPGRYAYGWEQWNVQPQGGGAVSDLTDVTLTDLSNGQVLVYNSSTNKWVNDDQHGGVTATYDATTKTITFA